MKKITQIENIILLVGFMAVVFFALPTRISEVALQEYTSAFAETGREFHMFWNYTFVILYKAGFIVGLFLFSRRTANYLIPSNANYNRAITLQVSLLLMAIIILTRKFDPIFITGFMGGKHVSGNLGINILDYINVPIRTDGSIIWVIESIGAFVVNSTIFISLYFLIRIYWAKPSWQSVDRTFLKQNKADIARIFLSQYFVISILQFNDILPFSSSLQDSILPLLLWIPMFVNIFLLYPRIKTRNDLDKVSFNVVVQFYMASVFAILYFLLFNNYTDMSLSMAYVTSIPSLFITIFAMSHAISIPYYFVRRKAISANSKLVKKVERQDSELSLLKSQINPHFLFNSLNTAYGLALEEESPKAAESVQKLSDMMRFMLQENTSDKISLASEIKYIHNYIDFQRLRIESNKNIRLDIKIDEENEGQIAPMLLIPMIENAFKHGISMNAPSWIKVVLNCKENELELKIENSMHPKTGRKTEESGIGLENVRRRLEILYPEKHDFQLSDNSECFEAYIKVTLS